MGRLSLITVIWVLWSSMAMASGRVEYALGGYARTYPIGGSLMGELGYRSMFWGKPSDLINGFIRPSVGFTTAGVSNGGRLELELAPINLVSFFGGLSVGQLNATLPGINCDAIGCEGVLNRSYFGAEALAGAGLFAVSARFTRTLIRSSVNSGPWIDPNAYLIFHSPSGQTDVWMGRLIYRASDKWLFGVLAQVGWKTEQQDVAQDAQYLFFRCKKENYALMAGLGRFNSGDVLPNASAFGYIV